MRNNNVRYITMTGMLSAISFVFMYFEISVPFMPGFLKLDLSELPALIGAFAFGPICGILVCLIKNILHLTVSNTAFVGEVANFLMGAVFVGTAGFLYERKKTKRTAAIAAVIGAVLMGGISIPINYFITYPFYYNFMSKETILAAYQAIIPSMKNIFQCLICFNFPFTIGKGLLCSMTTLLVYKQLSPLVKGRKG